MHLLLLKGVRPHFGRFFSQAHQVTLRFREIALTSDCQSRSIPLTGPVLGGRVVALGFSRCGVDVESFRFDLPAPKQPRLSDFPDTDADLGLGPI
jgi:hypothetical protein